MRHKRIDTTPVDTFTATLDITVPGGEGITAEDVRTALQDTLDDLDLWAVIVAKVN